MAVEVRRGAERPVTRADGRETRYGFSFGAHYDPANTSFGLLVACNEDLLQPGAGYGPHPHRDLEIITWVLSGSLLHEDDAGGRSVLGAGAVQRMTAGRGVVHSEVAGPEPVHLVQTWLVPDTTGLEPGHEQADVVLEPGRLVLLAGPSAAAPVRLAQRDAVLHAAALRPGDEVALPDAPYVHAARHPRGGGARGGWAGAGRRGPVHVGRAADGEGGCRRRGARVGDARPAVSPEPLHTADEGEACPQGRLCAPAAGRRRRPAHSRSRRCPPRRSAVHHECRPHAPLGTQPIRATSGARARPGSGL